MPKSHPRTRPAKLARPRPTLTVLALAALAAFAPGFLTGARAAAADKPHIVVILVDDMGYGDVGCFNPASKIPTPHIDRLAEGGMRFTDAHAPGPLCHPSRYGLITGQHPFRADPGAWRVRPTIDEGRVTVASLLRDHGYRTAMVGKWHLGFAEDGYDKPLAGGPVDRGFDSFFGIRASTDIPPYFYIRGDRAVAAPSAEIAANRSEGWSPIQGAFWRAGGIAPGLELKDVLPRFTDEAVAVIKGHAGAATVEDGGDGAGRDLSGKPLFLYLAYPAPHTPWLPSKAFAGVGGAGMYGEFTAMVDAEVGKVLAALDAAGMAGATLVVFTSDNGPVWYPHDVERTGHDSVAGLRGMKSDGWEGGHRMPFIARWPGRVRAGSTSAQTLCFTDLMATFAAAAGADLPAGAGPDSFNFLPVLLGRQPEDKPVRESIVVASGGGVFTVRQGPWKLITALGSGGFSKPKRVKPSPGGPAGQLYHLGDDLGERTNRYLERPEVVKRLQAELKRVRAAEQTRP